jgi:uncharacterized protein
MLFIAVLFLFLICSCTTVTTSRVQKKSFMDKYKAGDYNESSLILSDFLRRRIETGDELMWRLEEGALKFELEDYYGSLAALEEAEEIIDDFDQRATINSRHLGVEAGSLITNPSVLPYIGYNYDRILLNTYKALNYFALGEPQEARVELRRACERQKDAKRQFKIELKSIKNSLSRSNQQSLSWQELAYNREIRQEYKKIQEHAENNEYGSFINPFTTYLMAIGYLTEGDYSEAYIDLMDLFRISPNNKQIQKDLVTCAVKAGLDIPDELSKIKPNTYSLSRNIVYVIYAHGLAPAFKENKIQLVLPKIGYTGFAYPSVEYINTHTPNIRIENSTGKEYKITKIADMDNIISQEFKEVFPLTVSRIAASTLAKEMASYAAIQSVYDEQDKRLAMVVMALTSAYKAAFNTADTRCWQLLPNEFHVTNFPIPDDGIIEVSSNSYSKENKKIRIEIDKMEGDKIIIFVRSPSKYSLNTIVCQFF